MTTIHLWNTTANIFDKRKDGKLDGEGDHRKKMLQSATDRGGYLLLMTTDSTWYHYLAFKKQVTTVIAQTFANLCALHIEHKRGSMTQHSTLKFYLLVTPHTVKMGNLLAVAVFKYHTSLALSL
ncbi:Uncharacterised protein at_DN1116 [Pycnogonum litorale]